MPTAFNYDKCMKEHDGFAVDLTGRKIRLLCKDRPHSLPVLGLYDSQILSYTLDGRAYNTGAEMHLFTPDKMVEGWINIYSNGISSRVYESRVLAEMNQGYSRIACVFISCKEGEGLQPE